MEDDRAALITLDPDQERVRNAIVSGSGPLRVAAVAGSGKSRTLVGSVALVVERGTVAPEHQVVTSFTRKAADTLKRRLGEALGSDARRLHVGTFHSLILAWSDRAAWDLRRCVDVADYRAPVPGAGLLWNQAVTYRTVDGVKCADIDCDEIEPDARDYATAADRFRGLGIEPGTAEARKACRGRPDLPDLAAAWTAYEALKKAHAAWDYADLIAAYAARCVSGEAGEAAALVLVDEAQDQSRVQLRIAEHWARRGRLILIGDSRQSIYLFRGADPDFFVNFKAPTLSLARNYRSLPAIVAAGNRVAAGQSWSVGDPAVAVRTDGLGEALVVCELPEDTAVRIERAIQKGAHPADFAILTRTNHEGGEYEAALAERKIPCAVVGRSFWEEGKVQAILAYIAVIEHSDVNALRTIANKPKRFLPNAFLEGVRSAFAQGLSLYAAIERAGAYQARTVSAAAGLVRDLRALEALAWPALAEAIVKLLAPRAPRASGVPNTELPPLYEAVLRVARRYPSGAEFLAFVDRCRQGAVRASEGEQPQLVTISTIHRSKGLEWRDVTVPCTAGSFPRDGDEDDPEERRLAYVAFTRAMDRLTVVYRAKERGDDGKLKGGPSVFANFVF